MKFIPLKLPGAFIVEPELISDERGFFARSFCRDEFSAHDLRSVFVQCSVSFNRNKGTLRGMHFQRAPFEEAKLVRCTSGEIYDVIVDLRPNSPTFMAWDAVELTAANHKAVYVAEGMAHGFLTRTDSTEVLYQMSNTFEGAAACGVRWNDPAFAIRWPDAVVAISERDRHYPDFAP